MRRAATECGIHALLAWFLLLAIPNGFAQGVDGSSSTTRGPKDAALSRNAVTSDPNSGEPSERLMQLLRSRPELAAVLKSYLAQQLRIEGDEVDENSITNQMLYSRIQTDPQFAKDASKWLVALAAETSSSLQAPPSTAGPQKQDSKASIVAEQPPPESPPAPAFEGQHTPGSATNAAVAEQPSSGSMKAYTPVKNTEPATAPADSPGEESVAIQPATAAYNTEEASASLRSLPKNLLIDQKAFWTLPFHLKVKDLTFIVPATFGTALLVGSDTAIEAHLPTSPNTVKMAANASTAGMAALVGTGGGLFLVGQMTHDEHKRETGLLMGEAAIDAYAASTAVQYITQRERPFTGNGRGQFFYGGSSFPSNTAAVSWAAAAVITREYPGTLTKLLAYGVAAGVSAGRVIGEKHWTSDAVLGSALGWYMGRQIYQARSAGPQIDAATWGTFEKGPDDEVRDPAYMGTTYMPLDSWVYPAFERLAALGYLPTEIIAIRPWPRLECARLVLEAEEQMGVSEGGNSEIWKVVRALRQEFAIELTNLEGARNVGAQLESAYARVTQISGRPLRDSYDFAQTLYDDYGRPYGQGFNAIAGVSGRAEAGPLAFYVRGEFQHSSSIADYSLSTQQAIVNANGQANGAPNLPLSSVPTFNGVNQFRSIEAYVALNVHNWQVSFGQQSLYWGPDSGSSLMFSNNAQPEVMLRVSRVTPYQLPEPLSWLGKIRNTIFIGRLGTYTWLRGPYPIFPVYGSPSHPVNPIPYTWGDKLALKMTQNFEVGVTLSVVWAGQGRPTTLQTWLHTFSTMGNAQRLDPGKRYNGINCSYRLPKLRDWVTLYIDGMANDEPNPIAYPQDSAFNPGLYFPKLPKLPKLDLRVEGIYTNVPGLPDLGPYYQNNRYAQGYTNYSQIIGSWVGRQGDAIQAWSTYWFSAQNKIQVGYRRQWNDPIFLGGGGLTDFSTAVDWLVKRDFQISSTVQYEHWNFPLVSSTPKNNVAVGFQVMLWPVHDAAK
jgi:membrane-associated phospholipid phosphatase